MKRVTGMTKGLVGSFAMIIGRKTKMFFKMLGCCGLSRKHSVTGKVGVECTETKKGYLNQSFNQQAS